MYAVLLVALMGQLEPETYFEGGNWIATIKTTFPYTIQMTLGPIDKKTERGKVVFLMEHGPGPLGDGQG